MRIQLASTWMQGDTTPPLLIEWTYWRVRPAPPLSPPSPFIYCADCNSYLVILLATVYIVNDCYATFVYTRVDVLNNCIRAIQWNTHHNHEWTYLIGYLEGGEADASPVGRLCSMKDNFNSTYVPKGSFCYPNNGHQTSRDCVWIEQCWR